MVTTAREMVEMIKAGLRTKYDEMLEDYDYEFIELLTRVVERKVESSTAEAIESRCR